MTGYRYRHDVLLNATVKPYAALLLFRRYAEDLEHQVRRLDDDGYPLVARELLEAIGQLRRAGDQVGSTSDLGQSDGPIDGAESESNRLLGAGLTASQASRILRVSPRQVTRLAAEKRIRGAQSGGRWLLDPESVAEYAADRSTEEDHGQYPPG